MLMLDIQVDRMLHASTYLSRETPPIATIILAVDLLLAHCASVVQECSLRVPLVLHHSY